jgi:pyruvate,water dikinase
MTVTTNTDPAVKRRLRGLPASRGLCTGPVRLVQTSRDWESVRPGDVVVCPSGALADSANFSRIGGLITDRGGVLSNPAIRARELNIPAVVATRYASRALIDGQIVTVNGTEGIVTY